MRQRALDAGVFVIFAILVLGLMPGAAADGGALVADQGVARIAPVRRSAAADVSDEIAGDALVGAENENALGMSCGKLAASRRRAGLVQHRRALPRRLGQVNRVNLIMLSVAPHTMDLGGIGEDTILLVAPHGTVFPARLPQLVNNGHVLIGGVVPTIVVGAGPSNPCRVPRCRDSRSRCSSRPGRPSGGPTSTCDGRTGTAARKSGWR